PVRRATRRAARSVSAANAGRPTKSRGGYPLTASSGKSTMSEPAASARRPECRIRSALPSKSPIVVSIWATATVRGREVGRAARRAGPDFRRKLLNGERVAGKPVRRRGRAGVGSGPQKRESRGGRGEQRPEPPPGRDRCREAAPRFRTGREVGESHSHCLPEEDEGRHGREKREEDGETGRPEQSRRTRTFASDEARAEDRERRQQQHARGVGGRGRHPRGE